MEPRVLSPATSVSLFLLVASHRGAAAAGAAGAAALLGAYGVAEAVDWALERPADRLPAALFPLFQQHSNNSNPARCSRRRSSSNSSNCRCSN